MLEYAGTQSRANNLKGGIKYVYTMIWAESEKYLVMTRRDGKTGRADRPSALS